LISNRTLSPTINKPEKKPNSHEKPIAMRKIYKTSLKPVLILLVILMPLAFYGQSKKDTTFARYLYINGNAGITQYFGDLNKNDFYNKQIKFAYGLNLGYQFSPLFGVRGQFMNGKLISERPEKTPPLKLESSVWDGSLNLTLNISNLIGGYKERTVAFYGFGGGGISSFSSRQTNLSNGAFMMANGKGNSGDAIYEFFIPLGLGSSVALTKNFDLNVEYRNSWFLVDDKLDMYEALKKDDHYGYASLGLTYKLLPNDNIKYMAKNFDLVKCEQIPNPLVACGDSVKVTIKGTFPPKYFSKKAAMYCAPQLKYAGGSYKLKPVTLKGEDVEGDGIVIPYKEGGTFSYTQTIPYSPSMNSSEDIVAPLIYVPKGPIDPKAKPEVIKENYKYVEVPDHKIGDGVIYTGSRVTHDEELLLAEHGYQKEIIISKAASIYFVVDRTDINWKLPLNKSEIAKGKIDELTDFIKKGYAIRDIDINGWASPEGEESHNIGLSENRTKAGMNYMTDLFKKMNKDKNSTIKISDPENMIKFNRKSPGEDWTGFMSAINASNIPDKRTIANVVNSQTDLSKREQEIRNMTIVYKEIETDILPPLRRVEIAVNCFEPRRTDEQIAMLAATHPDSLECDELLYAATLTNDKTAKEKIYKSAASLCPNDWKAQNNNAYMELENGNNAKAIAYLEKANSLEPNNAAVLCNLGVLEARRGDNKKAEAYYSQAQKLGASTSYNQGILDLAKCDYSKALSMFGSKKSNENVALAQMMAGDNTSAISTLKNAPKSALNSYLMAIVGARTNDKTMMLDNLTKAIVEDPAYKAQAAEDREFIKYFTDTEFLGIVK
jgi:tetratricopeptide (TPR) repeat protein/outer membrane protein OmpA-like peptidoglycan-associated protein